MATIAPLLIAITGFGLYFLISTQLAIYRRYPWEFLAIVALGTGAALYRLGVSPGVGTLITAASTTGILGLACWYIFSFSMFGRREDRPRVGEQFPDFTLPASNGPAFHLAEARGRRLLILFYRGIW